MTFRGDRVSFWGDKKISKRGGVCFHNIVKGTNALELFTLKELVLCYGSSHVKSMWGKEHHLSGHLQNMPTLTEKEILEAGTSPAQWPRLCTPKAGGPGSIPGRELDPACHMKNWHSQITFTKEKKSRCPAENLGTCAHTCCRCSVSSRFSPAEIAG